MGFVQVEHSWYPDDQPWEIEVNNHRNGEPYLIINFPKSEDADGSGYLCLDVDIAENLARNILDALVDARLGKFTNDYSGDT